jgi:hypothetical protein
VDDKAFGTKMVDVCNFRIYGSEEKARIGGRTIANVPGAIVPSKANTVIILGFLDSVFETVFGW